MQASYNIYIECMFMAKLGVLQEEGKHGLCVVRLSAECQSGHMRSRHGLYARLVIVPSSRMLI
jgi:hypothetical protein